MTCIAQRGRAATPIHCTARMTTLSVRYAASMVGPCVCGDNDFRADLPIAVLAFSLVVVLVLRRSHL